jgi:uncharacterized membrane protein
MISWVFAVGRMVGFGTAAGVRASLTLVTIGILSRLEWGAHVSPRFMWLHSWVAIMLFILLTIFEATFDKVPSLDRLQDTLIMPYRIVVGALAGAATIHHGWTGFAIGMVVGAAAGWFGQSVKHGIRPRSTASGLTVALISMMEDMFAFVGAAFTAVFSLVGYGVFAANLWLFSRLARRRRAKYKGLRVLR